MGDLMNSELKSVKVVVPGRDMGLHEMSDEDLELYDAKPPQEVVKPEERNPLGVEGKISSELQRIVELDQTFRQMADDAELVKKLSDEGRRLVVVNGRRNDGLESGYKCMVVVRAKMSEDGNPELNIVVGAFHDRYGWLDDTKFYALKPLAEHEKSVYPRKVVDDEGRAFLEDKEPDHSWTDEEILNRLGVLYPAWTDERKREVMRAQRNNGFWDPKPRRGLHSVYGNRDYFVDAQPTDTVVYIKNKVNEYMGRAGDEQ